MEKMSVEKMSVDTSSTVSEPHNEDENLVAPIVETMRNNNATVDQDNSDTSTPNSENIDLQTDTVSNEAQRQVDDAEPDYLYKWLGNNLEGQLKSKPHARSKGTWIEIRLFMNEVRNSRN